MAGRGAHARGALTAWKNATHTILRRRVMNIWIHDTRAALNGGEPARLPGVIQGGYHMSFPRTGPLSSIWWDTGLSGSPP